MDIQKVLAQLHAELEQVDAAILSLEQLEKGGRRRGRPPQLLGAIRKRGRPPGRKNKKAVPQGPNATE